MAKTGPQKYPGASTSYWYGSRYPGSAMETNVIVWHSTEGTSLPSYGGGASAPTLTAVPDFKAQRVKWYQHFDFDVSARALVNKSGGVETNTMNVCQVEVVGTCDPSTHAKWKKAGYAHLYMPELPAWVVRDLGAFAKWAHDNHGVKLASGLTFKAYPGSYGSNGVRMSGSRWLTFYGHCGHQHVPENDHGDPGAFPIAAILNAAAGGGTSPTTPEEDDMPVRTSLGKSKGQAAKWGEWTPVKWDKEHGDTPRHADGNNPGYNPKSSSWADFGGQLVLSGLQPGDQVQVRYEVHDWKNGKSTGSPWTEIVADHQATPGGQFISIPCSKHLESGQHVYVSVKPLPASGRENAPAPTVTSGRWTIRQDR